MRGVDTYGLFILSGWPWHPYLIYFALCMRPSTSPLSHLHRLRLNAMPVRCHCSVCKGTFVAPHIKRNHDRTALKKQTVSQQNVRRPGLASVDPIAGGTSTAVPIHLHNTPGPASLHPIDSSLCTPTPSVDLEDGASRSVLDVIIPPANHDNRLGSDPAIPQFDPIDDHFPEDEGAFQGGGNEQEDFPDEDALPGEELDCVDEHIILPPSDHIEDTDPFLVDQPPVQSIADVSELPKHLLAIYTIVSWLHIQFNLPRIACNALLEILACLVTFFNTQLALPFVTLPSVTRSLAVAPSIDLLPVCPNCQDVFPSAASQHVQDTCTSCKVPLFLPSHTNRGNLRNVKTPVIKYPYLLLSQQLVSVLKIPSIEALLDNWRTKPRKSGEYEDIFDGDMCRVHLKAPDGSKFFSNLHHERQGPGGELRIGVNLGVDWCVLSSPHAVLTHFHNRFSYICSNIAPSHSSCPTSFSICNLPPEYR